jgi:hypothetical protein
MKKSFLAVLNQLGFFLLEIDLPTRMPEISKKAEKQDIAPHLVILSNMALEVLRKKIFTCTKLMAITASPFTVSRW